MKIAFVTPYYDPQDIRRGSGTFYYMSRELERQGCEVEYYGPIDAPEPFSTRVLRFITKRILRKRYLTYLDPAVAHSLGKELQKQLEGSSVDLVLTNDPGVAAGLEVEMPVVYYSDVMLPAVISKESISKIVPYADIPILALKYYKKTIRQCLENVRLCVFPAQWLQDEALKLGAKPEKIRIIPFGANIPDPGASAVESRDFFRNAAENKVRLLFVGVDWHRKGGDIALQTAELLKEQGLDVTLDLVGVNIDDLPSYVRCHGLLRKNNPEDWQLMDQLYRESDVFIFPSRSEGSAIVPREAAAYGLPTLAYRIEGVMSSIADGKSGVLLPPGTGAERFAREITDWLDHPERYKSLSLGAREFFEVNANWAGISERLIQELIGLMETYNK